MQRADADDGSDPQKQIPLSSIEMSFKSTRLNIEDKPIYTSEQPPTPFNIPN